MVLGLGAVAGFIVGALIAWFVASSRAATLQGAANELRSQLTEVSENIVTLRGQLEGEQKGRIMAETKLAEASVRIQEEKQLLEDAKTKLTDAFKAIAGDTLNESTSNFLRLAKSTFDNVLIEAKGDLNTRQEAIKGLVNPLSDSLKEFNVHVKEIEKSRQEGYAGLAAQLTQVSDAERQLKIETSNLVTALRRPEVRGRWGEITLHRVVELAGMVERCDFCEQVSVDSEDGRKRPDMIVYLPGDREIVVDSKVPIDAYLDAIKADSEEKRKLALAHHAAQVRSHMEGLASKGYWNQFNKAPEFVVMFIAGESFFGAACESDNRLMEDALQKHVVMATPATLIALLRSVAFGWRQEQIAKNAQAISDLGKELFERMSVFAEYMVGMGKGLEKATEEFNKGVGSIETRVLVTARRFKDLGVASNKDIAPIEKVQVNPRLAMTIDDQRTR
ncbi:MAG: DNA recombination protein RmuC [Dehalococcoides mccartyi]|uniref:DNA recombination protein RmuC n=1 Tax=Dehalococcoides mccartyi TaxID=61435 RepID=UPI0030F7C9FC